jgi:phage terminase small subunit
MPDAAPPPDALGDEGRTLWSSILADLAEGWEFDARDFHRLEEACVLADQIALLDEAVRTEGATVIGSRGQSRVHPAVAEARQLRLAQHRLLGSLQLEDPAQIKARMSPTSRKASHAARSRWGQARARGEL